MTGDFGLSIGFVSSVMAVDYIWLLWITQRDKRHGRSSVDIKYLSKAIKAEKCPEAKAMLAVRHEAIVANDRAMAADLEARIPVECVEDGQSLPD